MVSRVLIVVMMGMIRVMVIVLAGLMSTSLERSFIQRDSQRPR